MVNKMKKSALMYIFLLFLPVFATAGVNKDIKRCANKNNDADKLICYENIAHKLKVHPVSRSNKKNIGQWKISRSAVGNNNRRNVTLKLAAKKPIRAGNQPSTPYLSIRCINNRTSVQLEWNAYIADRDVKISRRFDQGNTDTRLWLISSDYTATFPKSYNYIRFTKALLNHSSMDIEVSPYGRGAITASFDLTGIRNAIWPLRKACEW